MNQLDEVRSQIFELIQLFEITRQKLIDLPAVGEVDLVFADVRLLNHSEADTASQHWLARRVVRTDFPQVFIWLFRGFVPIASAIPGYGQHKEEIFGRLGNTLEFVEALEPPALINEKVVAVIQDFWEICQDLMGGRLQSRAVAIGSSIEDDFVIRAIQSGFIDQNTFKKQLFGEGS